MEASLFLAKLFGIYFVLMGVIFLIRRSAVHDLIKGLKGSRPLVILLALGQIVAGIAVAITFSPVTADYRALISIIGYWMIVEGVLYILLSKKAMRKFLGYFDNSGWYISGGIISIILGAYLVCKGFGWWM